MKMKYKLICSAVICLLICLAVFSASIKKELIPRNIQHTEQSEGALAQIYIETENSALPSVTTIFTDDGLVQNISSSVNAKVRVQEYETAEWTHHAAISFRGHSSMEFEKKQYKISFKDNDGTEDKTVSFLGMEEHDEWALNGPYLDRSLMRNYLCYNIAGQIMPYTPDAKYCELYINGEYEGLYLAVETIAKSKGRVDISSYEKNSNALSYIICADWTETGKEALPNLAKSTMEYSAQSSLYIVYPGKDSLTDEYKSAVTQEVNAFERTLYSKEAEDGGKGYRKYIDVDSFVDYFIINEFFQNSDAGIYSTYFYKDPKGKLCAGPVWDFNSALENDVDTERQYTNFVMTDKPYFEILIKDSAFVEQIIKRYRQLRKTVLSEEYLMDFIKSTNSFISTAAKRNNEKWGKRMYGENIQKEISLNPSIRNPKNYDDAVNALCEFVKFRGEFLDEGIETLRQYSHKSAVKRYNQ